MYRNRLQIHCMMHVKKVNSTIIPGDALLLRVASKRAIFLRSLRETGCSILLISFYLIYKMAI